MQGTHIFVLPLPPPSIPVLRTTQTPNYIPPLGSWAGSPGPKAGLRSISVSPTFALEGAGPLFGPQVPLGRVPRSRWKQSGLMMAATRAGTRAREIFTSLEYGPVPESHACALVRACLAGAAHPPPQFSGRRLRADSRDPPRQLRNSAPFGSRDSFHPLGPIHGGRSLKPLQWQPLSLFVCCYDPW